MQEQLPLRPAEFVKIRDGFIAFLKQPAGTPIEHVIPQAVIDNMVMAAQRGRKRRRMLDSACSASVLVAAIGAMLAIVIEPMIIGIVILLTGGAAFIGAFNRRKIRRELEIDELVTEPNEALQRNLRALDDFRNLIANGDMTCEERLWGIAFAILLRVSLKNWTAALIGGAVVLSHWFLDLLVHVPDLTLAGSPPKLGLGLWNHPAIEMPLEIGVLVGSALVYARTTRAVAKSWLLPALILFLFAVQAINWFGPPPAAVDAGLWGLALFVFVIAALFASWVARNRVHR
jgi:hypothetical protein